MVVLGVKNAGLLDFNLSVRLVLDFEVEELRVGLDGGIGS